MNSGLSKLAKMTPEEWVVYRQTHFVPFVHFSNGWWNVKAMGHGQVAWSVAEKRFAKSKEVPSDRLLAWFEVFKADGFKFDGQDDC